VKNKDKIVPVGLEAEPAGSSALLVLSIRLQPNWYHIAMA
jgi:hypothetical protein